MTCPCLKRMFTVVAVLLFSVLLYFMVPLFMARLESNSNWRIASKVSNWPFMQSTLQGVLTSLPNVRTFACRGHVECAPLTNEGTAEVFLRLSDGREMRLVFYLINDHLYPATQRTKQFVSILESCYHSNPPAFSVVNDFLSGLDIKSNVYETCCSPQVLNAKPLKGGKGLNISQSQ